MFVIYKSLISFSQNASIVLYLPFWGRALLKAKVKMQAASRFGRAEQPCRGPCMDMGRAGSKRWLRSGCIGTDE